MATIAPTADVFARTIPFIVERHYFGENRKASTSRVSIDRSDEPEVAETDRRYLSLTKRLINSPEIQAVRHRDAQFRDWLYAHATPWRPGMYLVPVALAERAVEEARRWEAERAALVAAAAEAYPAHVQAMRVPLGVLYNPADYPPAAQFAAQFWVSWRFVDMGVPNLLRQFKADVFRQEQEKLRRQAAEAGDLIRQHLRSSLLEITSHLAELLTPREDGKRRQLKSLALDGLDEFLATIEARDVTGDGELGTIVGRLRGFARGLTVEQLRNDDALRTATQASFAQAVTDLEQIVELAPSRRIRLRETA